MHRTRSRADGWTDRHFIYYYKNLVRGQGQGHSDPKMVSDTRPSQDASTHQIWNSYLKEYRKYAPDMKLDGRTVRLLYASQSIFGGIKKLHEVWKRCVKIKHIVYLLPNSKNVCGVDTPETCFDLLLCHWHLFETGLGAMGMSSVCDCGIFSSYSLFLCISNSLFLCISIKNNYHTMIVLE